MPHALIVDDDIGTREALSEIATLEGFTTSTAGTLAEARERFANHPPHVVLIDLMLPDGTGLDLLQGLEADSRPEVVLITGHATVDSAVEAIRHGARDYLVKPVEIPRLKAILDQLQRTLALQEVVGQLGKQLGELGRFGPMIGSSPAMQQVYDLIARVAPTEATVLVTGDSGTGKELVAQTLHELGTRRKGPFIPVNCGAVPANLIESELFGHERGSFTGATQMHRGFFERASGGTLFLDEITEMPAELQAKLLRVIETGKLIRVGGEQPIAVDVRLVAATNRSPETAVRQGVLREDLYYRLNVFPIHLPPLRERGRDVEMLAQHFLENLNQGLETPKALGALSLAVLRQHTWPGNVRELLNVIHRAFIMAETEIEPRMLGLDGAAASGGAAAGSKAPGSAFADIRAGLSLDEIERRVILATLEHYGGDKKRASEVLGISLKTIYNRLNLYANRARPPVEDEASPVEPPL